ncbi:hypothetical protein MXB_4756 [Myxobolus squamalis]|nr:hypothetical protein MXB_4756 [Myxobolus squamalis]
MKLKKGPVLHPLNRTMFLTNMTLILKQ